jgi:predicted dehydrogenase
VEKPLSLNIEEAKSFLGLCKRRGILVQVNLMRRADEFTQLLAQSELHNMIGPIQTAFGIYGNGLFNNGSHMIDLVSMLIGETKAVQATGDLKGFAEGPIAGDINLPFTLVLHNDIVVPMQPIRFSNYRENGLDIWGTKGRFSYLNGGITLLQFPVGPNRIISSESEVFSDKPIQHVHTLGKSFYKVYSNLASAVHSGTPLLIPGEIALRTIEVAHAILKSAKENGKRIELADQTRPAAVK